MSIRFKLANWISGGKYQHLMCGAYILGKVFQRHLDALEEIEACETKSASATVRRMARIAREALKGGDA